MDEAPPAVPLPRGRHGLSREEVLASQRGRMLHAMAKVVAERGLAKATVADVIRASKVSRETFYEHFENKLDCFLAAYQTGVGTALLAVMSAAKEAKDAGRSGRDQFSAAIEAYLRAIEQEPLMARAFLIEILTAGPEQIRERAQVHQQFVTAVGSLLEEPGRPVDRFTCEMIIGGISSVVTMRVAAGEYEGFPALHAPIMEHVDRLLAASSLPASSGQGARSI